MRVMDIPRFPHEIEIPDLDYFLRTRLGNTTVMWPDQAIPLLGYMCHPNDKTARDSLMGIVRSWPEHLGSGRPPGPRKLPRIQTNWLKVADIFQAYCDMLAGGHQKQRGGPSLGKAITLVEKKAKTRGTGESRLWELWGAYKDVAHLVTAATLICAEARRRLRDRSPGQTGLRLSQFVAFQMALLLPDLVSAVAMGFERYGLRIASDARAEPALDRDTLWRIPAGINVELISAPIRELRPQDRAILRNRRAGNRGRPKPKT
jgi:hypothetical protein